MSGGLVEAANALLKQPLLVSAVCSVAAALFFVADGNGLLPDYGHLASLARLIATAFLFLSLSTFVVVGLMRVGPRVAGKWSEHSLRNEIDKLADDSFVLVRQTLRDGSGHIWVSIEHPGIEPLRRKNLVRIDQRVLWATKIVFRDEAWSTMLKNYETYSTRPIAEAAMKVHQEAVEYARWTLNREGYDQDGKPTAA